MAKPDYETMERFISAIQKLVIKDVVQFTDRKLDTYKSIVSKDALGYLHAEQKPLMAADGNSSDDLFLIDQKGIILVE